jgi:hypothetical protein
MHIERVPNRNSPPAVFLRQSYREDGKVRKRTLASLSKLPDDAIEGLRNLLSRNHSSNRQWSNRPLTTILLAYWLPPPVQLLQQYPTWHRPNLSQEIKYPCDRVDSSCDRPSKTVRSIIKTTLH